MDGRDRAPLWSWALVGAALGLLALDLLPPSAPPLDAARRGAWRAPESPARMVPRELRSLPGVGERRARAASDARFSHDPGAGPLRWSDVPGIGEGTEARVRAWLGARGAETELLPERTRGGPGMP